MARIEINIPEAITSYRVDVCGDTPDQIQTFGAMASVKNIASVLGVSEAMARIAANRAVAAGTIRKEHTNSRRNRIMYAVLR